MKLKYKIALLILPPLATLSLGLLLPGKMVIPVTGATRYDWNHHTFWNDRWGRSGVHKGIDIFAKTGSPVISATSGIVIFTGQRLLGGNVVAILGPKWRIHYYAHLNKIKTGWLNLVRQREVIGTVGRTGNARKRPAHLHYSVMSLLPLPWRWDDSKQGWKKAFFLDPTAMLLPGHRTRLVKNVRGKNPGKKLARSVY